MRQHNLLWNALGTRWKILIVIAGVLIALFHHRKQQESRDWEATPGVIEYSHIRYDGKTRTEVNGQTFSRSDYDWDLRYRYTVNGHEYTGTRYHYGLMPDSREALRVMAEDFPTGAEVTVYVNPDDPSEAVLKRDR